MISQKQLAAMRRHFESKYPDSRLRGEYIELYSENIILKALMVCDWPTQAEAARWVGVHRGQINRAIGSGRLETNAKPGRCCRINPASLWHWRHDREARERLERCALSSIEKKTSPIATSNQRMHAFERGWFCCAPETALRMDPQRKETRP